MNIFIDATEGPCRLIRNPVEIFLISHFIFKLPNDFKCQLTTSFCLQNFTILYGKKLYLIFGRVQFSETFQLNRINAIKIVSSTDVTFRKSFQLKERSLTLFPFGNVVNLVYLLVLFANKMTSSANLAN